MSEVLKVLGQENPAAKTLTDAYTVPASTEAKVYAVLVCNRSQDPTTFRIAIAPAGAADDNKHYQWFDRTVKGNDTLPVTLGPNGVTLATTDKIRVYAYDANLSFSVHGVEVLGGVAGVWTPWTATYTNLTLGVGTVTSEFIQVGDLIVARFKLVFASDTTIDATDPGISMPVTPHASYTSTEPLGPARILDSGSVDHPGSVRIVSGKFNVQVHKTDATYAVATAISATVPMTFTTNDIIAFTAEFKPA